MAASSVAIMRQPALDGRGVEEVGVVIAIDAQGAPFLVAIEAEIELVGGAGIERDLVPEPSVAKVGERWVQVERTRRSAARVRHHAGAEDGERVGRS